MKPMRRTRFLKCLKILDLGATELALMINANGSLGRFWATGDRPIPPAIAEWLEACVKIRLDHPLPPPPVNWRARPPQPRQGIPRMRLGNTKLW